MLISRVILTSWYVICQTALALIIRWLVAVVLLDRLALVLTDKVNSAHFKDGALDSYEVFYHKHKFLYCTWNILGFCTKKVKNLFQHAMHLVANYFENGWPSFLWTVVVIDYVRVLEFFQENKHI